MTWWPKRPVTTRRVVWCGETTPPETDVREGDGWQTASRGWFIRRGGQWVLDNPHELFLIEQR